MGIVGGWVVLWVSGVYTLGILVSWADFPSCHWNVCILLWSGKANIETRWDREASGSEVGGGLRRRTAKEACLRSVSLHPGVCHVAAHHERGIILSFSARPFSISHLIYHLILFFRNFSKAATIILISKSDPYFDAKIVHMNAANLSTSIKDSMDIGSWCSILPNKKSYVPPKIRLINVQSHVIKGLLGAQLKSPLEHKLLSIEILILILSKINLFKNKNFHIMIFISLMVIYQFHLGINAYFPPLLWYMDLGKLCGWPMR